jgi:hypothetical protein
MTRTPATDAYERPLPDDFDPAGILDDLVFDAGDAAPDDVPAPPGPLDKVTARSTVTIPWDYRTRLRIEAIAQARGITVGDVLEELAELEVARLDALEARARRAHDAA